MTDEKYVRELEARVTAQEKEIRELRAQLEKLERRIAKYDNAHTPSSAKPYYDKPTFIEQKPKPSGRPEGHEGVGRKTPDEIHEHVALKPVAVRPDCGGGIRIKRRRNRYVTRLKPGFLEHYERQSNGRWC
jgi:uncharacterized coiled-coil protein SlyX